MQILTLEMLNRAKKNDYLALYEKWSIFAEINLRIGKI